MSSVIFESENGAPGAIPDAEKEAGEDDPDLGLTINLDDCVDEFGETARVLEFKPKPRPPAP